MNRVHEQCSKIDSGTVLSQTGSKQAECTECTACWPSSTPRPRAQHPCRAPRFPAAAPARPPALRAPRPFVPPPTRPALCRARLRPVPNCLAHWSLHNLGSSPFPIYAPTFFFLFFFFVSLFFFISSCWKITKKTYTYFVFLSFSKILK